MKTIYAPEYRALLAWLRSQRLARNLTMRDVGARLKKPHSWVGKVETGERRLDLMEFVRVCKAIGIDPVRGLRIVTCDTRLVRAAEPPGPYGLDHDANVGRPDKAVNRQRIPRAPRTPPGP
jgi:transcriptional regulator with XRE-family HTH domain